MWNVPQIVKIYYYLIIYSYMYDVPEWALATVWSLLETIRRYRGTNSWTEDRFDWIHLSVDRALITYTAIACHRCSVTGGKERQTLLRYICFFFCIIFIIRYSTYGNHQHIRIWLPFHQTIDSILFYRFWCSSRYYNWNAWLWESRRKIDKKN